MAKVNKPIGKQLGKKPLTKTNKLIHGVRAKPPKLVEIFYKSSTIDSDDNDQIRIRFVGKISTKSSAASSGLRRLIVAKIQDSGGFEVRQIGVKPARRTTTGSRQNTRTGGHVFVTINREEGFSPFDIVANIREKLTPEFHVTGVRFSHLPGGPTGPGPGPRPPKPK